MKTYNKLLFFAGCLLSLFLTTLLMTSCGKKDTPLNTALSSADTILSYVKVTENKSKLDGYWKLDHIKEWYHQRIMPPPLDMNMDLTKLNFDDLWFLKNELLARNGYLFLEPTLRAHFMQFKWYQPIYNVSDFTVELNKKEYEFLEKIVKEEKLRLASLVTKMGQYDLVNYDMTVNRGQFKNIPAEIAAALKEKNFVIVSAAHEQLFHVYEKNAYDYTPSFITTDLFFQVLQKHTASVMNTIEKEKLIGWMNTILTNLYENSAKVSSTAADSKIKDAADWAATYYAIPLSLLNNRAYSVPAQWKSCYDSEIQKCVSTDGFDSKFLNSALAEYSQFKPRGNYAGDAKMEGYFRCVKWLGSARFVVPEPGELVKPVTLAYILNNSAKASDLFKKYHDVVAFLAGDENNISVAMISQLLQTSYPNNKLEEIVRPENLKKIYDHLKAKDPRKFQTPAGTVFAKTELSKMNVVFSAGAYTIDNEIFSKLVHILWPDRKRLTPKSLDVFAALGNKTADSLLKNFYKEQEKWPGYNDSLNRLQEKFSYKKNWDDNIFSKTLQTTMAICNRDERYPLFMRTHYWDKKNLNTAQTAYTQLRHDFVLYIDELMAAECGDGYDGPQPAVHLVYVEPNIHFWEKSTELINLLELKLKQNGLSSERISNISNRLLNINSQLTEISRKELEGRKVTDAEMENVSGLGGFIAMITADIFGGEKIPDRYQDISSIINVYGYRDSLNNNYILNEGMGRADEIYVVALINGLPYITKGAVWSHYEFISQESMIDSDWKEMLNKQAGPKPEPWMNEIKINAKPLETKPENRYQ